MWSSIAAAAIIGVIVAARTLLAKLFGYPPERVAIVKLVKLPAIRGTVVPSPSGTTPRVLPALR